MTSLANTFNNGKSSSQDFFLGVKFLFVNRFSFFFAALLKTFRMKKEDMIPFLRGRFRTR